MGGGIAVKKILSFILIFLLIITLAGCGAKKKIEEKVGEAVVEKVLEKATGSQVKIDGDKITIKDKETGATTTFGSTEWPKTVLIPEFKGGTITGVVDNGDGSALIIVEKVEKKDFENYYNNITKEFTNNTYELKTQETTSYGGENKNGYFVQIVYEEQSKSLTIATAKN